MKSYLLSIIILVIISYISLQKSISNLSFRKIEEKIENYSNLKEWISQLQIKIPNVLIDNIAQGQVKDVTIYGINLNKIEATNPEVIDNKIRIIISLKNAEFNISGEFKFLSLNKSVTADFSKINAQLPVYLVIDTKTGLVKEVNISKLNIDLENADIDFDLQLEPMLRNTAIQVLGKMLIFFDSMVLEPRIELLNTQIRGLIHKINSIFTNEAEPKKLNITIREQDILDLKKFPLIGSVSYILNNLIGTEGPLSLNSLVNILTSDTGIFNLHGFYNERINFEYNLTGQNNDSLGKYEIELEDLNISGLNTWKKFTALEPYNKLLLYFYYYLQNLTINASFLIKVKLDNSSIISANETILYEKVVLNTNLQNNSLNSFLQLPIDNKKSQEYSSSQCLNIKCLLYLIDSNGTGLTGLSLNNSFSYFLLKLGKQEELEKDLNDIIDKLIYLLLSNLGDKIGLFINALLNKNGIDFINKQMNNYLYSNYCPRLSDEDEIGINKLVTCISFISAFILFILVIFKPYILGKICLKQENNKINKNEVNEKNNTSNENNSKIKNINSYEINTKYCCPDITIHWIKELGRIDSIGASLFLHPDIPIFWRIFIPLAILLNIALYISLHTTKGNNIYIVFEVGRRIKMEPLYYFGIYNTKDLWEREAYFLSLLFAFVSGFWAYTKLLLMMISFFLPTSLLSTKKRGIILMIVNILGKYSFINAFVLIIILVVFHIHIEFPVIKSSEANHGVIIDLFSHFDVDLVLSIIANIISLFLTHIIPHLHRSVDDHLDQNKGEKAESYKALICFAKSNCFGKIFNRIFITIILFSSFALVIIGSVINSFSFHFYGLARYFFDLLGIETHRDYNFVKLGSKISNSYENSNAGIIRFLQVIYYLTIFVIPIALQITAIFLWLVPLPRKAQKFAYTIVEILKSWSFSEVLTVTIIYCRLQLYQFTKLILGNRCDLINPFIDKYFYKNLDGHNTCFEVKEHLKSGFWILLAYFIIFLLSSEYVMYAFRNALKERLPEHVKNFLKNKRDLEITKSISNFNENNNNENNNNESNSYFFNLKNYINRKDD